MESFDECKCVQSIHKEMKQVAEYPRSEQNMTIRIVCLSCPPFNVEISSKDMIGHLCYDIYGITSIPYEQQVLIFDKRELDKLSTIASYGINNNDTIYFKIKLTGGKPVILYKDFYSHGVNIKLKLPNSSEMCAMYPLPEISNGIYEWKYFYNSSESVFTDTKNNVSYPYIFYEFNSDETFFDDKFEPTLEFVGDYRTLGKFLHKIASDEGMDDKNCMDFVTYWLPQMMAPTEKNAKFRFQILHEEYEKKVPIIVEPMPEYIHRFFMIWKRYDIEEELEEVYPHETKEFLKWKDVGNDKQVNVSYLLEWGGMSI